MTQLALFNIPPTHWRFVDATPINDADGTTVALGVLIEPNGRRHSGARLDRLADGRYHVHLPLSVMGNEATGARHYRTSRVPLTWADADQLGADLARTLGLEGRCR